jgi:hypothetical protein
MLSARFAQRECARTQKTRSGGCFDSAISRFAPDEDSDGLELGDFDCFVDLAENDRALGD